jgi:DNA transposition AAA+ family ATPase
VTTSGAATRFIETKQYHRFKEFCDACRQYQYIGLCYGPPGVGKTVSARYYTDLNKAVSAPLSPLSEGIVEKGLANKVVLYTPSVVNSPGQIARDIGSCRSNLSAALLHRLQKEERPRLKAMEQSLEKKRCAAVLSGALADGGHPEEYRRAREAYLTAWKHYQSLRRGIRDVTMLLVIDEADRLKMASLEQVRAIFDQGGKGLVLIGMPGIEKRLARYPQLYSRVGFVHEFKPLSQAEVRQLLREGWSPSGASLPKGGLIDEEAIATLIRIAEGKFRLLDRLLTQIGRVMEINRIASVTPEVVEAARENLVIGTA